MLLVCVNTEHIISKLIHFNTLFRFSWCWNIIAAYVSITIWTFKRLLSTFVLEVAKFIWTFLSILKRNTLNWNIHIQSKYE